MDDFLTTNCTLKVIDTSLEDIYKSFDCGNDDLNDFFQNEAIYYCEQLLGKTYFFTLNEDPSIIVCAFTISNDSIRLPLLSPSSKRRINRCIPYAKHRNSYPALLIGRLGVNKDFSRRQIGTQLMNFIKAWFINKNNKTGCRFITVDAYNTDRALNYYRKNHFKHIFSTEEDEKNALQTREQLYTRALYFDLIDVIA